jgi:hypothetical protein
LSAALSGTAPVALVCGSEEGGGRPHPQRVRPRRVSCRWSGFETARKSRGDAEGRHEVEVEEQATVPRPGSRRQEVWPGANRSGSGGEDTGGGCHGPVLEQEEGALREIRRGWGPGQGWRHGHRGVPAGCCWLAGRMVQPGGSGSPGDRRSSGIGQVRARVRDRGGCARPSTKLPGSEPSRLAGGSGVVQRKRVPAAGGVEGQSAREQGSAAPQWWGRPVDFRAGRSRGRLAKACTF